MVGGCFLSIIRVSTGREPLCVPTICFLQGINLVFQDRSSVSQSNLIKASHDVPSTTDPGWCSGTLAPSRMWY